MQLAVISDIHGNWAALNSVMTEIQKQGADRIICLGDTVNPLPSSARVLKFLSDLEIPIIRGNHEDYIIKAVDDPNHEINHLPNFRPIHLVSKTFTRSCTELMKRLPMNIRVGDKTAGSILFCHASPKSNNKGWAFGVAPELAQELIENHAENIVCGHWHDPKTTYWNNQTHITTGSVGLPMSGKIEAEFLMLEARQGEWVHQHMAVPYNSGQAVSEYIESGWFSQGGPMAWLLMAELATAERQVAKFFPWMNQNEQKPRSELEWSTVIRNFLEINGSWALIESFLYR